MNEHNINIGSGVLSSSAILITPAVKKPLLPFRRSRGRPNNKPTTTTHPEIPRIQTMDSSEASSSNTTTNSGATGIMLARRTNEWTSSLGLVCRYELLSEFVPKFILEVLGGAGAIWGFSEACGLRRPETIWFWRPAALCVGALFWMRFVRQVRVAARTLERRRKKQQQQQQQQGCSYDLELGESIPMTNTNPCLELGGVNNIVNNVNCCSTPPSTTTSATTTATNTTTTTTNSSIYEELYKEEQLSARMMMTSLVFDHDPALRIERPFSPCSELTSLTAGGAAVDDVATSLPNRTMMMMPTTRGGRSSSNTNNTGGDVSVEKSPHRRSVTQ
jgi:hypothetical protein